MDANDPSVIDVEVLVGFPGELEAMLARQIGDARELFPNALRAIQGLALAGHERWIAYANGAPLSDGRTIHNMSGSYAASIQIRAEQPSGDVALRYVIYSDAKYAHALEFGTDPWDMRRMLETSSKVRISKEGHRYLVIPFRWGSRGSLAVGAYVGRETPTPVQSWWLKRDASMISGTYQEPAMQGGGDVTRYTYRWGDRLTANDVRDLGLDPDEGAGRNMVGMVKMRNPGNPAMGSTNMTFRVLSEKPDDGEGESFYRAGHELQELDKPTGGLSWQHPGTKPYNVAGNVAAFLQEMYPSLMDEALNADIAALKRRIGS